MTNNAFADLLSMSVLTFVAYRFYRKRQHRQAASPMSGADSPNPNSLHSRGKAAGTKVIVAAIVAGAAWIPIALVGGFVGGALSGLLPQYKGEIHTGMIGATVGLTVLVFFADLSMPFALFVLGLMACGLPGFLLLGSIDWDGPLTPLALLKLVGLIVLPLLGTIWSYWCWSAWREERKWKAQERAAQVEGESGMGNL